MSNKESTAHGDETSDISRIAHPDAHHEVSDVRVGLILKFGVFLSIATIVSFLLMWGLFNYFEKRETKSEPPPSPLASERQAFPPEPRLQLAPTTPEQLERRQGPNLKAEGPIEVMKRIRQEEIDELTNYGWVNKNAGIVRLPIEDAKRLALEKGAFPHR